MHRVIQVNKMLKSYLKGIFDIASRGDAREEIYYDIKHYCKIVTTIARTIETQDAIDKIYPKTEGELL